MSLVPSISKLGFCTRKCWLPAASACMQASMHLDCWSVCVCVLWDEGSSTRVYNEKKTWKLESKRFFHVHTWLRCRLAKGRHSSTSFQVSQVRFGARDYHLRRSCICCNRQPMAKRQWTSKVSRLILPNQASGCSLVVRTCCIRHLEVITRHNTRKTWHNNSKLHELAVLQTTLCCPSIYFLLLLEFALQRTEFCIGHWRGSTIPSYNASWGCLTSKVNGGGNLPTAQSPSHQIQPTPNLANSRDLNRIPQGRPSAMCFVDVQLRWLQACLQISKHHKQHVKPVCCSHTKHVHFQSGSSKRIKA